MQKDTESRHGGISLPCSPKCTLLERHSTMYLFLWKENNTWETTTWKRGAALLPSLLNPKAPGFRRQPLQLLPIILICFSQLWKGVGVDMHLRLQVFSQ